MPPKSARGRKKATTTEIVQNGSETKMKSEEFNTEEQGLNHNNLTKLSEKEANKNLNTAEDSSEVLQNLNECPETVAEIAKNSKSRNVLVSSKLKEAEFSKEITNGDTENGKLAPPKRGRKKADVPAETIESVPVVDENNEKSLGEQNLEIATTDLSKSNVPEENETESNGKNKPEPDIKVEISNDTFKVEEKKVPQRRGRPKRNNENTSHEQLQAKEEIPLKRGRRNAKVENVAENVQSEQTEGKVLSKREQKKAIAEKVKKETNKNVQNEQFKTGVKVPLKRGRKNEKQDIQEEPSEEKLQNEKVETKRGRKKANIPSSDLKKIEEEPSDTVKMEKFNKAKIVAKDENEETSVQVEELPHVKRKRKNEAFSEEIEQNKHNFNETKVLKVSLQRDASIDKMSEEQTKIAKKGGSKNTKAGSKRTKEADPDSEESVEKSPKMAKGESKSKGQSKKDKMPDVKLIDFSNSSTSPSGKPWNFKISSWNVNGIRAWLEKDGLAYVSHENPDVITFQETKCSDKMLPDEVNIPNYHSYWLAGDKDGYSGVGLLSKKEPVSINYGIGVEEHDNEGRVITAEYEAFYLVTAYVPNAGRKLVRLDYRMQWDKDFRTYLKSLDEKKPVVLCGDLNVAHEEIDLANPKSNKKNAGFTKEEREGFSGLLSEGFIDSFRHLYPDVGGAYTFWTYMMNSRAKNVGWRLDYFVLSKKLADHLCDNVIRKDVFGSDHCPITLFLSV